MEQEFKTCHKQNNVPYPQEKVEAVKTALKQAVADMIFRHGLPEKVKILMRILVQSLQELTGGGQQLFCKNCQEDKVLSR